MAEIKNEACEVTLEKNNIGIGKDTILEVKKALTSECGFDKEELESLLKKFQYEKLFILEQYFINIGKTGGKLYKGTIEKTIKDISNEHNTYICFKLYKYYKNEAWAKEVLLNSLKGDTLITVIEQLDEYKDEPFAIDILSTAIKQTIGFSRKTLDYLDKYKDKPWYSETISQILEKEPDLLIPYLKQHKSEKGIKETLIFFINKIKNSKNKNYLKIGSIINKLHSETEEFRFMIISGFDEHDMYKLITKGRSEVFTSTYNGVLDRLLPKLKSSGKDIYDLASENNFEGINTFIEASGSYGRLEDLFNTIGNIEKKKKLLDSIFDESKNTGLNNYVAIVEIINAFKDETLLKYIGEKVKINFQNSANKNAWGIIAKYCSKKFPDDEFFKNIEEKYKLPEIKEVENKDLFNERGENVQQYYFYNDDDGKSSYDNFLSNYKGNNWKIEDKKSFIIIKSKTLDGKSIIIYANKPENDGSDSKNPNGAEAIKNELSGQKPKVIVHRGHSFHASKTLENIVPENILVFLGSCGGFQNIEKVLNKSENAQIISTKGTGVKAINDPLFKFINDQILSGKSIVWGDIWKHLEGMDDNNFEKYVRPDQNLGAMFYKKFTELERKN